ncbi:hypothetical protein E4U22_005436 [Claviceps purpurea]|nr:hypothetical protein E4U12_005516 [Claviceps purpurea]KAG6149017.1 hypothetical protein E4U28_002606 [Claviceps purpurea]KAG6318412.1 hypothetical protein E4U22_005436 [Claviceps purpurea]
MLKHVALSAGLIAGAHAFWRMECPGRVGVARIDPIVNPGTASPHAHAIHGSNGISASSDSAGLMNGDCTSCRVTQDMSAYWHPALYFEDAATHELTLVPQVGGMLAYYLLYGNNVTAFPKGFQMVAGSNTRRTYTVGDASQPDPPKSDWAGLGQTTQSALEQRAIGFNCLNYAKAPEGTLYRHKLPDKSYLDANCANGVRFELMFPSCWNGRDLDSENHKDHMAYPDLVMDGHCQPTHPVRVPSLLFEIIWDTTVFKNRNGRFVLSNGDVTGYGLHGDFVTGWEPDFLQSAIQTCTNDSGRIQDCPLFHVVDEATATSCKMKNPLPQTCAKEDVSGPMAILPGGINVGEMPHEHGPGKGKPVPTSSKPAADLPYNPGERPTNPASPLPGQAFKEEKPSAPAANGKPFDAIKALNLNAQPTTPPHTPTPGPQVSDFSTQYITNGNMVTEVIWEEEIVTVYTTCTVGCNAASATPTSAPPAVAPAHRRHAARHIHGVAKLG